MKRIGPSFSDELKASGVTETTMSSGVRGINMTWGDDGTITFGDDMTQEQKDAVMAVLAAHVEPPTPPPSDLTAEEVASLLITKGVVSGAEVDAVKAGR